MTSFSSIYSSLTGLFSFSATLNTISNNVANLNTVGFKASDSYFRDLGPQNPDSRNLSPRPDEGSLGQGVEVARVVRQFSLGDIESTTNPTDLAINGTGFFVLKQNGQDVFTQAGQFKFDSTGHLIDSISGSPVEAIDASGKLSDIVVDPFQTSPFVPTTEATFAGNLSTGGTTASTTFTAIDASGVSHTLTVAFQINSGTTGTNPTGTPGSWLLTVTDEKGTQLATGEIRFDPATGTPQAGFNTLSFNLPSAGGQTSTIKLNFGDPGSTTGATSASGGTTSTIQAASADGVVKGTLSGVTIDASGTVQLTFSNGKTGAGQQLAIASFTDPDTLDEIGSALFTAKKDGSAPPSYGTANSGGNGAIKSDSLELANVDLSQEFSKIIIVQRGYQGASEVLNVSSKLLESLYNAVNGQ